MAGSITSANAVIILTIPGLYNTPQQIQGFSADNVYETDNLDVVETSMGVDGLLSGGYVFNPVNQTITLQADSASNAIFEAWAATQRQARDVYPANGSTTLKSINREYISTRGFLVNLPQLPAAGRILQPRRYQIRWQMIQAVPV